MPTEIVHLPVCEEAVITNKKTPNEQNPPKSNQPTLHLHPHSPHPKKRAMGNMGEEKEETTACNFMFRKRKKKQFA